MLQTDRNQFAPYPDPESAAPEPSFSIPELIATVLGFIQRRWVTIVIPFALITALGVPIVLKLVKPLYNAAAEIYIDNRRFQIHREMGQERTIDGKILETQVELVKSENVGLAVVRNEKLATNREFGDPKPGLLGRLLGAPQIPTDATRERRALSVLATNMGVKLLGATYVMEISYKSADPDVAARIANGIANAYIQDLVEGRLFTSKHAVPELNKRLKELSDQLIEAQARVKSFKAVHQIIEAGDGRPANVQQIQMWTGQQATEGQKAAEIHARVDGIEKILSVSTDDSEVFAKIPDGWLKPGGLTKKREEYVKIEDRYRQLLARQIPYENAQLEFMRKDLASRRIDMRNELKGLLEAYKSELETAQRTADNLQQQIDRANSQLAGTSEDRETLGRLESEVKSLRSQYETVLQRRDDLAQQQKIDEESNITEARVITAATPPPAKDYRKTLIGLAVVPLGGLVLGIGLAFLLELMDDVFYTERQVQKELGTRCLAIVPMWQDAEHASNTGWTSAGPVPPRTILRDQTALWSVSDSPFAYFAESVRSIKAAADMLGPGNSVKVIGFTSAVPNEGKSTVAASLAQVIAQSGSRVILIDCDLRNPSLSAQLAPVAEQGLVEVVSGKAAVSEVIWTDPTTGMAFLPTVMKSRVAQTNEILASDRMKKLFDTLRLMYDYVVVDLSPLAPVVDVRSTANLVDTYVFVIEWGKTHTSVVRRTLEATPSVVDSLLGVVLNKTDLKLLRRYDSHHSKYREKGYYRY
jgi:polysaccharide biosynthesis transport protein